MNLIRAGFMMLAMLLPTSWTLAHADDMKEGGEKPAETKKSKSKKTKKKESGDMGDMKKEDAEKK